MSAFEISHLKYAPTPKGLCILDIEHLVVNAKGLTFVIGSNGSGKTTFLKALTGLNTASHAVKWGGVSLRDMNPRLRSQTISWVPTSNHLPFPISVFNLVLQGRYPWHLGSPGVKDRDRIDEALESVGLGAFKNRLVATLSSGEQKKVHIARAIASEAKVIILDEPSANLDIGAQRHLWSLLSQITNSGVAVIVSSHDIRDGLSFADHVVALKKGKICFDGASASLSKDVIDSLY